MRQKLRVLGTGFAWIMLLGVVQACTCAPSTVDLVQPNAVEKSVFMEGEWFFQNTVVEVPYGTAAAFTGRKGSLTRIRWKIEEDRLIGYRSYEHVNDSSIPTRLDVDGDGLYWGAPVVGYSISKHFDIRRSYSRSTGEEYNVIEENTERPWYEREFMRVDWSTNVFACGTIGGVDICPSDFYPENPNDPLAPMFDDTDNDGVIDSILLTRQVFVRPDTVFYPGYGYIPICWFYGRAYFECDASEVSVTSSFLRVDPDHEYAGLEYDDRWMRTFGYFETMRLTYDDRYALAEENRVWYANRHNLWGAWFQKDGDGNIMCSAEAADGSMRTAACASFAQFENPRPLMLRYNDRPVRKVVFHVNEGYDARLLPVTIDLSEGWNVPFRDTINGLRFWECLEEGGSAAGCEADTSVVDPNLQVFVLCPNNPSVDGDPEECSTDHTGDDGVPDGIPDVARRGDLRYNFIDLVANPMIASPFGYGPSAADPMGIEIRLADDGDPRTPDVLRLGAGEIINATAHVYEHALNRVATGVADLVELINGNISYDEYIEGENVEDWVHSLWGDDTAELSGEVYGRIPKDAIRGKAEVEHVLDSMDSRWAAAAVELRPDYPERPEEMQAYWEALKTEVDTVGLFGGGAAEVLANWDALRESPFDDVLWNYETIGVFGFDPVAIAAGAVDLEGMSPLDLTDPAQMAEREYWDMKAGMDAVCLEDQFFTDPTLLGLAMSYANTNMDYEAIWNDVRVNTYRGVMEHEIGHTVGLRHNFGASYDAFNYPPQYWELRNDGDMGPRHIDPETPAETMGRIREYMYSSVMDYHAGRNSDWQGLGRWDEAAIKFGYGQLVEAMTAVPPGTAITGLDNKDAIGYIAFFDTITYYPTTVLTYTNGEILEMHYTDYPGIAGDFEARIDVPMDKFSPTASGVVASAEGYDTGFGDMLVINETIPGVIEEGWPAAPYRFCSDEFAYGMTCARFDEGADPYEIINFTVEKYWNYYLLNNFKRGRYGFRTSNRYLNAIYGRYLQPLHTWARYYSLFHSLVFDVDNDPDSAAYFAADKGFGGWTLATGDTFQMLMEIVMRPDPGEYVGGVFRADGTEYNVTTTGTGDFTLPLITGSYYSSTWDFDSGYHWFDKQTRIGSYWDKRLALQTLTLSATYNFLGIDYAIDPRSYALGFQDLWRDQIALFLGDLIADDRSKYGPVHMGDGKVMYPDVVDTTRVWPPAGMEDELIRPGAYWAIHYLAGIYGMALLPRGFDNSFLDRARIYKLGNGESVTPEPGMTLVQFTDRSGVTYVAWSDIAVDKLGNVLLDGDGNVIELGSGARTLRRANLLKDYCNLVAIAPYTDPPGDPEELEFQHAYACGALDELSNDIKTHADVFNYFWTGAW